MDTPALDAWLRQDGGRGILIEPDTDEFWTASAIATQEGNQVEVYVSDRTRERDDALRMLDFAIAESARSILGMSR